jgi:hypothetical protein
MYIFSSFSILTNFSLPRAMDLFIPPPLSRPWLRVSAKRILELYETDEIWTLFSGSGSCPPAPTASACPASGSGGRPSSLSTRSSGPVRSAGEATSVADPDPFDTDPDPDPAFQFDPDPDVWYGSGSLPFQRGNVPKTVLLIHLYLIFLVSRSNRTHTKDILC